MKLILTNSIKEEKTDAHSPTPGHPGPEAAEESLSDNTESPEKLRERDRILRAKQEGDVP